MNDNLFGVRVPDAVIERLDKADDPKREGRKLCASFVNDLKDITDTHGVHLMAPGNFATMPALLDDLEVCLADR